MTVAEKLAKTGPRRLLALDGGGVRGVISIEVLGEIERTLQAQLGRGDDFVLADYFDYIAGTSTGAIIATGLALGLRVEQIRTFYRLNARDMFDKAGLRERFRYLFRHDKLAERLRGEIGADTTLGSDKVRTLLLLVMRNASTNSPWPLSNNPAAAFNRTTPHSNLDLPLWQLVRASTAAPLYFPPEVITVGEETFVFVDGGVTVYNNPAFQLFLMATVEPYNLNWPTGREQMLLVSIGTGNNPGANTDLRPDQMNVVYNAASVPAALMSAALHEQDFLCRTFGDCRHGERIDSEVGDMIGARGPLAEKLFTYLRYDVQLSRRGLDALGLPAISPEHVQKVDSVDHLAELTLVGEALAKRVQPEHFAGFLS